MGGITSEDRRPGRGSKKIIPLRIDEETYRILKERAEKEGYLFVSDYLRILVEKIVRGEVEAPRQALGEKLRSRIERIVQDMVNQQLEPVYKIRQQVVQIYEKLDMIEDKLKELENQIKQLQAEKQQVAMRTMPQRRQRKTGIQRLREEKVLFESSLRSLKYRDSFFKYLEREGAVIINLSTERVAIDPEFWEEFKQKLFEEIKTNNEDEIKKTLSPLEYELFRRLRQDAIIYYDSITRKWKPAEKELF